MCTHLSDRPLIELNILGGFFHDNVFGHTAHIYRDLEEHCTKEGDYLERLQVVKLILEGQLAEALSVRS